MNHAWRALAKAEVEGRVYSRPTQAVILAGGRGQRMRPITDDRPKPMVPILGRPFLEYQIEQLRDQGFQRVLILLGYLPDAVRRHFGDGRRWGISIAYSVTDPDQLTSGRVAAARHLLDPCFLLLYCDNYWPMQIELLWARFREAGRPALITTFSNKDRAMKGSVVLDAGQNVLVFDRLRRHPGLREVEISYAIITDLALSLLPDEDALFEEAIYTPLARQGRLAAYVTDHQYYSIGSPERLPATEHFFRREPTVILDRDGVLNRRPPPAEYVRRWDDWSWSPGAREALLLLREAGYRVLIASNQPGIGRNVITNRDLTVVHDRMLTEIRRAGGEIEAIYCCPHHWDAGCDCRKPKPGLLYQAQRDFHLDLTRTPFIGDDERDEGAARAAGCPFFRVTASRPLLEITRELPEVKGFPVHAL